MALLTIEGVSKEGRVELSERPGSVEAPDRVLATFLPAEAGGERERSGRRCGGRLSPG